ncbi:hypothetical protein ASPVEDRAFT_657698 [Aspergillus versicolor CBS 583.65]|uniref:Uncharacterized protein n=1 Tax=Aspergillus versicolor CBS 583.65 TaxID=1036611 RepID=A0A1L9PKV2_ASPVE|nr:uncharacterized protein ASPVEDRAFT_657698 [Aspergillus versicolor CBS 583.65]OJJ02159.1 hypothetical protein ASPVEDRAFT_657698 [Aspergillus versicolor CBS 583.65]
MRESSNNASSEAPTVSLCGRRSASPDGASVVPLLRSSLFLRFLDSFRLDLRLSGFLVIPVSSCLWMAASRLLVIDTQLRLLHHHLFPKLLG